MARVPPPAACSYCSDSGVVWSLIPAIGVGFLVPCPCQVPGTEIAEVIESVDPSTSASPTDSPTTTTTMTTTSVDDAAAGEPANVSVLPFKRPDP